MKLHSIDCMLVGVYDPLDPIALRVEVVSVHSEAVRGPHQVGRNLRSEAKHGYRLVRVIELKDGSNGLDSL